MDSLHEYSVGKHDHSQSYYRKIALAIKKVCRLAFREGVIDHPLFDLIKSKLPRALNRASLDKKRQARLEDDETELILVRNLFLFTYYTGTAFCDMMNQHKGYLVKDDEAAM